MVALSPYVAISSREQTKNNSLLLSIYRCGNAPFSKRWQYIWVSDRPGLESNFNRFRNNLFRNFRGEFGFIIILTFFTFSVAAEMRLRYVLTKFPLFFIF